MRRILLTLIVVVTLAIPGSAIAQDEGNVNKPSTIGIGAHIGWPTLLGPSVKAWLTPQFGVQGMGSFFSADDFSLTMLSGRALLKLSKADKKVTPYLGAGAGVWIADGTESEYNTTTHTWVDTDKTESVVTFEILMGFQHKYSDNFAGDYEIGYYSINFDDVDITISGMALSYAVHYFF